MSALAAIAFASLVTLADFDDARACTPLAGGGYAAATGAGLVIVEKDGKTTRTITALDGLPESRVHAVAEQGDGVWVGTEAGAAYVTDGRVARTVLGAPVSSVHVSASGAVWLGTRGQGVHRLATKGSAPVLVPSTAKGTRVTGIAEKDGVVFVSYADGPVAKVDGGTLNPIPGSPTHGQAIGVAGDAVVIGDLTGLHRLDDEGLTSIGSIDARSIAADGSSLLVGTYGAGVMSGTLRGALRTERGAPREVRGVGVRGAVRCAATTEGLFVDEAKGTFAKVDVGSRLPSNDVTVIAADASGKRVAVGTFDHGAIIVENGVSARVAGIDGSETVNAAAWNGGVLWLATAHGLHRVNADGTGARRFTSADGLPSTFTRAIAAIDAKTILVGTEAGPAIVDGDRITPLVVEKKGGAPSIASPMHATWAVAVRADGTMFIGTAAGLYWGKDGRFERASLASGHLEDDWITALAIDGARDVFVGTYSKGVTRLRFDGSKKEPAATHLGGGYVNPDGLVVANGKLFAATMEHLLVRPRDDDEARWEAKRSSSSGRDVTGIRFVGSKMWVASRRGITVI